MTAAPPAPRGDAEARRRIREDLDATLFVEAAAGTGKTTALVSRIVALLRTGRAALEGVVAVTFTEKAAGEMKLRLRAEIERARGDPGLPADERTRLDAALAQLELARIGTIHSFCADLLRERPVEAGVDPLFDVVAEDESRRLLDAAFDAWFERTLADPPEGVRRVLRRRPGRADDAGPRAALRGAVECLVEHRDFDAPWRRDPFDRAAAIDRVLARLAEVGALAARAEDAEDWLAKSYAEIARFVAEVRLQEAVRGRDHDGLEAALRAFARRPHWRWRGWARRRFGEGIERPQALERRDAAKAELDDVVAACDADLAPRLREELRPVVDLYEALKRRAGRLDFLDLLIRARDLVRGNAAVRAEFQARFTHFFVDEFQDTDPLQAEILCLLAAEDPEATDWRTATPVRGRLFLVGDPKQSIYRFRRADVALYEEVKRRLVAAGAEVLQLSTSFRGLPSLQRAVNAAFAPYMQGSENGSQAAYVPLEPFRAEVAERPGLVVLPVPRPYGDRGTPVKWRIEASFPDAAGAFVDWLVRKSGWTVEEPGRPGERVAIQPRHVCLLFRRFQSFGEDVTRPYVRALEARRVPHVLVGGRSFHGREEVLAIRNALCAIEWPDDELRVFATLRGPFFALGDDALLAYRHRVGSLHPLRPPAPEPGETPSADEREVADALAVLRRLHAGRNRRPVAETIHRLLDAVRAHAGIAIWPTGEQALANCLRSVDLARRFERRGASSFRAFVEHLEAEAERGESQDAPVVEEGTEGVRLMTVHRAKGLEFPVVILADPTANATPAKPSRHIVPERRLWLEPLCGSVPPELQEAEAEELRRDADEAVRLAYVAATRARDLLVAPGVGDADAEDEIVSGWLAALNPALYPTRETRRTPTPHPPGCPSFGDDSVYERPDRVREGPGASVRPGLHRPRAGDHTVVWWDPRALELDRQEEVGLRQQRILEADEDGTVAAAGEEAHRRWQADRKETLERASEPSLRVDAVTALLRKGSDPGVKKLEVGGAASTKGPGPFAHEGLGARDVSIEEVSTDRTRRPGGARFGVLVHAILAVVDLAANAAGVAATARAQARLVGASDEEMHAAAQAVIAALAHPLLRRAARCTAPGALRREVPILVRLDGGALAEGVVDLAFREDVGSPAWTVVDFKTDRELAGARGRYETQLRLYVEAIARATGDPARGILLAV